VLAFQQSLIAQGIGHARVTPDEFIRWFDLTGLQRHLKCVGIFHRLNIRDQKPSYMKDVPRVLAYIRNVLMRQSDLGELKNLIEQATILE
jgi:aminoglycoside/choline kinase family phosphotransferase